MLSSGAAAKADLMVGDVILDCSHAPVAELVPILPTTQRKLTGQPNGVARLRFQQNPNGKLSLSDRVQVS